MGATVLEVLFWGFGIGLASTWWMLILLAGTLTRIR